MKNIFTLLMFFAVAMLIACTKGFNADGTKETNSSSSAPPASQTTPPQATPPSTEIFTEVISSGATGISSGLYHSCAKVNDKLQCWGIGPNGECGPNLDERWLPQTVLQSVTDFHASKLFSCGIEGSTYKCWGSNGSKVMGETGVNDGGDPIPLLNGVLRFALGAGHSCMISEGGAMYCMGQARCGQMSDGQPHDTENSSDIQYTAKLIVNSGVASVHSSSSSNRTCLITTAGEAKCWGAVGMEYKAEACTGNLNPIATVPGLANGVTDIAVTGTHTCAVQSGKLFCWGSNSVGELGLGTTEDQLTPQAVPNFGADVSRVFANYNTTCALKSGELYCWGQDRFRRTNNFAILIPVLVPRIIATEVTDATIYANGICYLRAGAVKCSGNVFGEVNRK